VSLLNGVSVMIFKLAPTSFFFLLLVSQQGLSALPNPGVTFERSFGGDF